MSTNNTNIAPENGIKLEVLDSAAAYKQAYEWVFAKCSKTVQKEILFAKDHPDAFTPITVRNFLNQVIGLAEQGQ